MLNSACGYFSSSSAPERKVTSTPTFVDGYVALARYPVTDGHVLDPGFFSFHADGLFGYSQSSVEFDGRTVTYERPTEYGDKPELGPADPRLWGTPKSRP